jgi:predicted N-acyltransferase
LKGEVVLSLVVNKYHRIAEFNKNEWNTLATDAGPFLQYDFLAALENSGSVDNQTTDDTGWEPMHLAFHDQDKNLVGAVPGYLKTHSYGEYVFDHSWANAYAQYGQNYYPKWIAAIPFTPVTLSKLLCEQDLHKELANTAVPYLKDNQHISSFHWLFNSVTDQDALDSQQLLSRYSVQFQWHNRSFATFDDFLSCFKSRKRKDIRKERSKAQDNISISRLTGAGISAQARAIFYSCYQQTYLKRSGHQGYLTAQFFEEVFETMSDSIMLVLAQDENGPIASALFFYDHTGLYGRYWGALREVDGLHFECCYYQGIEFAIEKKLPLFNPGTQGEHKLLRGFEPTVCASAHYLHDQRFHSAVDDFLRRESQAIAEYYQQTALALPFNEQTRHSAGLTIPKHKIKT